MLPTPSTSHVNYDQIYEPAEDSYLLLDTLSSTAEAAFLQRRFPASSPAPVALEVGTGSGVIVAFVTAHTQHIFGRHDVATLGVDVNAFACAATVETVARAVAEVKAEGGRSGRFLGSVCGDLTTPFRARSVDVLIFNPPYVPTETLPDLESPACNSDTSESAFARNSQLLALSYAGGKDGMETTDRLLEQVPGVLSDRGVAYILLCAQNRPHDVISRVRAWPGNWHAEIVGSSGKKAGWEKLCILRIWRVTDVEDE